MTLQYAQHFLLKQLATIYDRSEATAIADIVLTKLTGLSRTGRLVSQHKPLNEKEEQLFQLYLEQLLQHRPVQYVLGEAHFGGLRFYVDEHVLIPRPETEELVHWARKYINNTGENIRLLDIGTGSGCIAVSLKKEMPTLDVSAIDLSEKALVIAQRNARFNNTPISFLKINILEEKEWTNLGRFDIIISNPPYVTFAEKKEMQANVLDFEPDMALFVPNGQSLIFYEKIAQFGKAHLKNNGYLFFEINERFGEETRALLRKTGYTQIELKRDLQQKDRMVKCLFKK